MIDELLGALKAAPQLKGARCKDRSHIWDETECLETIEYRNKHVQFVSSPHSVPRMVFKAEKAYRRGRRAASPFPQHKHAKGKSVVIGYRVKPRGDTGRPNGRGPMWLVSCPVCRRTHWYPAESAQGMCPNTRISPVFHIEAEPIAGEVK